MFGNHQLLQRKLRKTGRSALATVVSCDRGLFINQSFSGESGVGKRLCKLELRVQPDAEPEFDVRTDAWFGGREGAHEGMVVPVLYDPSDHGKVVIDQSDEAWKVANRANAQARIDAWAAAGGDDQ